MITLLLDTSYKELNIGLLKDDKWLKKISMDAFKQQSEITMPMIEEAFKEQGLSPKQCDQIVITKGPGSYTGIRIGMKIAKVLGTIGQVEVFTLNTLEALAGVATQPTLALMDARSNRAYIAAYHEEMTLIEPQIMTIDSIKELDLDSTLIVGDSHLLGQEGQSVDLLNNMMNLKNKWLKVADVHSLVPLYLKDMGEYGN